jgi:hypothetical protein
MARNKGRRPGAPAKPGPTADKPADKLTPDKAAADKLAAQPT